MSVPIHLLPPRDPNAPIKLTDRERQVLVQISNGASNAVAGKRLRISSNTVKFYINNLLYKFDVHTRTHLVATAIRRGFIE